MNKIKIRGARTHNLKNIDLIIPRNKLIVITGLSGSGKSSLAFDTLYAEGQRRYVESLSTYVRKFLSLMNKPDVDYIEGLSPSISIKQKTTSHNPRSTVGTITKIYDYLRLLFARIGEPRCPKHDLPLTAQSISQMVDNVLSQPEGKHLMLLAPIVKKRKGTHSKILENLLAHGYIRARINGEVYDLSNSLTLELQKKHTIEVVVDRFKIRKNLTQRLAESFESALSLSDGNAIVTEIDNLEAQELMFSTHFACSVCGYSMPTLEPQLFSFNNPAGACPTCDGIGVQQYFDPKRVLQSQEISLANGAIHGWDRRNFYHFQMILSLAMHYKFNVETPFQDLSPDIQQKILFGSEQENINFVYINDRGDRSIRPHPFEGVLPNIKRRYKETKSSAVREELAKYISNRPCITCNGTRLRYEAHHVFLENTSFSTISEMNINQAFVFFNKIKLNRQHAKIAEKVLQEIQNRFKFLLNVGLYYLTLSRSADTLSGGEAQRIRLASQIGTGLVGVMYILDEPSIGLHQRDHERLLKTLTHLRNLGNTIIVVEHDADTIRAADHIIDIGPGAGVHGGQVVAEGNADEIMANSASLTGQFLSGKQKIIISEKRIPVDPTRVLKLVGACSNNLKNITLTLPLGLFICITGVSGSGKSTLINNTLLPALKHQLNGSTTINKEVAPYRNIQGLEYIDKVIEINQSPIGRSPRSNPATYTGVFTPIRELFSSLLESRSRGYTPSRFSFNVRGGRCEACQGDGVIKIAMHFLPDTYVLCDQCKGQHYNRETLEVKYKSKNIQQVLEMTIEEAQEFFNAVPTVIRKLNTLIDVGLSYIRLGQSAITLSGGEAQRVKLARELSKHVTGQTLYILDEPTTGLHFADIQQLLPILYQLRNQGNTIIIIEHNLDVIKNADWIVDLGPEGGDDGGEILVAGTPEVVAACKASHTARFLAPILKQAQQKHNA